VGFLNSPPVPSFPHQDALAAARRIGYRVGMATALGSIGLVLVKKGACDKAVPNLAEALVIFLALDVAHGPRQTLTGLCKCDDALGRRRMQQLLRQAVPTDQGVAGICEHIDQMHRRRPRQRSSQPAPHHPTGR
jgi:hypothetical protein